MPSSVSVVIPTIGRPSLHAAILSALRQTVPVLEVVVASDSEEPLGIEKEYGGKVREIHIGPRAGGNVARNAGIRVARGDLIALLDDDDAWVPDKLECQLGQQYSRASGSGTDYWISATQARHELKDQAFPSRLPARNEGMLDYLFVMKRLRKGAMVTSTLVFPRPLALEIPFDESLRFHQDIDWLVAILDQYPRISWSVVPSVLTVAGDTPASVSKKIDVGPSLAWADKRLLLRPGTAYADFLLTRMPMTKAVRLGNPAIARVLRHLVRSRRLPSATALPFAFGLVVRNKILNLRKPRSGEGSQ